METHNIVIERGSLVGRMSVSCVCFASNSPGIDPRFWHSLLWKNNFPFPLIQEELVVSYWRKNGHLILVNCFREAWPGTVWLGN